MLTSSNKVFILLSIVFSVQSYAYTFKNFTLTGDLAQTNKRRSQSTQAKSFTDDAQPELLEKINSIIGNNYNQIGERESQPLILNHDIGGGVLNFSGFSWRKPAGSLKLYANREITPDMFSDNYIVHDTLTISIDASTYLTQLKDSGQIEISETQIGAFIGIGFQRVYHYYHFASSYSNAIGSDFSKLFLSFRKFNIDHVINMPPYEILKKQDSFYFNAGGKFSSPGAGVSVSAGVLVDVAFKNNVVIQSLGAEDKKKSQEFLRVSREKSWNISAAAAVSLQLDFFNILKLTLLQGELEYEYAKSNKQNLSFNEQDINLVMNSANHHSEFKKIINGKTDTIEAWIKNIISFEDRVNENFNSKYSVLLFGKIRKKQTEQVKIIKDGIENVFYTHYSQSTKYIQNLLSRLINIVVVKIFSFDSGVSNFAESSQKMKIEYAHQNNLAKEMANTDEDFSISLTQLYQVDKTHRWIDRRLKNGAVQRLKSWSNLDPKISSLIANKKLRGPLQFESVIEIQTKALTHLNSLKTYEVIGAIIKVCKSKRLKDWLNSNKREKMLRRPQLGKNSCVKNLYLRFNDYKSTLIATGKRDLNKLRQFTGKYFKRADNQEAIYHIFGEENVFTHGRLSAMTQNGQPFSTFFKTGQFTGLGVIDNFIREIGTVVPVK